MKTAIQRDAQAALRILSRDKAIQSRSLNLLGAQVLRTVIARALYRLRASVTDGCPMREAAELVREGMVTVPNFLAPQVFDELSHACVRVLDANSDKLIVHHEGTNRLQVASIADFEQEIPIINGFYEDPRLIAILQYAEKRRLTGQSGFRGIERLRQGALTEERDTQTELHSDHFYTVHKAWLYLTDVERQHGPLAYVKRSHHLSAAQLRYVYQESCGPNAGSRRITADEMRALGLEETVVMCPRNTLVVANTFGYHRRLQGEPGGERIALHLSLRYQPFAFK